MGGPSPVRQSEPSPFFESLNPLVSGFPADGPTPTLLSQPSFVAQKFLNESPPLLFITVNFPRHIARKVLPIR
jgi:hypothetical protein